MVSPKINTLEGPLAALRESEIDLINDVATTLNELGEEAADDYKRLLEMVRDLSELFFLVSIIGEFNAGKSTFVNALMGEELLPMGITPTTEVIELIRYNETAERKPVMRDDSLREWAHPNTGAPGVAIVDTPGTGSVFKRHEKIAKDFLHRSDTVVFILSAKRAFAETERIYLETARDYGKKIILVINQIDLLEESERATVRRFIEEQVKETLGFNPLMFMISAKQSLEAQKNGTEDKSGMDAVKAHLRGVFAEAPPAKQKLISQLDSAVKIIDKYHAKVKTKADIVKADTSKVKEVQSELHQQSMGLNSQLTGARAEVDKVFAGMRLRGLTWIDNNLSIRKMAGTTSRENLQAEFQDVVLGRAIRDINEATNGYINAVIDQSRIYWRSVIDRLNQLRDLLEQEVSGLDSNIYAEQREGLEDAIRMAEAELKSYSSGRLVQELHAEFDSNMNGFRTSALLGAGGLIGMITAILTPGPLAGAGAAALALPAFIASLPIAAIGGVYAYRYYRRINNDIKKDFDKRVDRLQETYHTALDDLTHKERNRLTQYGTQVLTPIFSRLDVLQTRYAEQQTRFTVFQDRLATLRKGIQES